MEWSHLVPVHVFYLDRQVFTWGLGYWNPLMSHKHRVILSYFQHHFREVSGTEYILHSFQFVFHIVLYGIQYLYKFIPCNVFMVLLKYPIGVYFDSLRHFLKQHSQFDEMGKWFRVDRVGNVSGWTSIYYGWLQRALQTVRFVLVIRDVYVFVVEYA